jgi:hypothetical protein
VSTARRHQENGKAAARKQSPQEVREAARAERWCKEGNCIKMEVRQQDGSKAATGQQPGREAANARQQVAK